MKKKFLRLLKFSLSQIEKLYSWLDEIDPKPSPFKSLSPIDDAENNSEYTNALNWALANKREEGIRNIALTGPYGSGKSSILKTYQKNCKINKAVFLNISLASFKDEKKKSTSDELLRLIELSILQQIFFHEKDSNTPDSRIKKIKNYKTGYLIIGAVFIFLLVLSILNLWYPDLIQNLLLIKFDSNVRFLIHYISLLYSFIGIFYLIFKSIRILYNLKITKLNFQNSEIEIDKKIDKSILNHHIDELIYFFEVTKHNVVIIEDLDRFEQTEIFTKLRELNLLINNSKKIKDVIVFIYAVKDDIFKDKDRTKFFDFIVPVIPIINSSNSNEKLKKIILDNNFSISMSLVEDISLFIDDMRLLNNILNEYFIYHEKLDSKLNQDKLLSIIVYKNIYPEDFSRLSNSDGQLYKSLNEKEKIIDSEKKSLDVKIEEVKSNITLLESIMVKDIKELRSLYISKYFSKLERVNKFVINGVEQDFNELINDDLFQYFMNDDLYIDQYVRNTYNDNQYSIKNFQVKLKFKDIEKEVDKKHTYIDRLKIIQDYNDNLIDTLKKKVEGLNQEKAKLSSKKLKDLFVNNDFKVTLENSKQNQLVSIMLRNGYIDEEYLDYISIFYEGSISKEDRNYLLNVKSQISTSYDYKLYKVSKLVSQINPIDFGKSYILNYYLLDYLLEFELQSEKSNNILNLVCEPSGSSIQFIDGAVDNLRNVDILIKSICKYWNGFWNYLKTESQFTENRLTFYLNLILKNASLDDLVSIANSSNLRESISNMNNFLYFLDDINRTKFIIDSLDIKFKEIDFKNSPDVLLEYVYSGSYYEINPEMIESVLKYFNHFQKVDFDKRNYSAIMNSEMRELIDYVNGNIKEYIREVYLIIETNDEEEEKNLILLLNNEELELETKFEIIKKVETKIMSLDSTLNLEIDEFLLNNSKVVASWENVIQSYKDNSNQIKDYLLNFLNNLSNATTLSNLKIENVNEKVEVVDLFIADILIQDRINNVNYGLLLKSVTRSIYNLNIDSLSSDKVEMLIRNKLLPLNVEVFDLLKSNYPDLQQSLLENNKAQYLNEVGVYELKSENIKPIINSVYFTSHEKNLIIDSIDNDIYYDDINILNLLGENLLVDEMLKFKKSTVKRILDGSNLLDFKKIEILIKDLTLFSKSDITEILFTFSEPYSEIAIPGKRPLIENTIVNQKFVKYLSLNKYISKYDFERKGIRISTFRS